MKKQAPLLFTVLLLLFSTQYAFTQKVTENNTKGLKTIEFETPNGKIKVFLPETIHAGDIISGSVIAEPKGKNEKQKLKNKNILNGMIVEMEENRDTVRKKKFTWKIPQKIIGKKIPLVYKNHKGKLLGTIEIPCLEEKKQQTTKQDINVGDFKFPSYIRAGEKEIITGVFDGDFSNTRIEFPDKSIQPLVESPDRIIFETPKEINGHTEMELIESNTHINTSVNILDLELSADKLNLRKSEQTNIHIKVIGLKELNEDVPLKIDNISSNINMRGGNYQEIIIIPSEDTNEEGIYSRTVNITALMDGDYSISVSIIPPEPHPIANKENEILCDCRIKGRSYLISPEACKNLGGKIVNNAETDIDYSDINIKTEIQDESFRSDLLKNIPKDIQQPIDATFMININGIPEKEITDDIHMQAVNIGNEKIIRIDYAYKNVLDSVWKDIGSYTMDSETEIVKWQTEGIKRGYYNIRAKAVNQKNQLAYYQTTVHIGGEYYYHEIGTIYNITSRDVQRARNLAEAARRRSENEGRSIDRLSGERDRERQEENRNRQSATELECIDETLERLPENFKDSLRVLIDSLRDARNRLPVQVDSTALQQAVDDAEARLDACKERLNRLKQEKENLENRRDELKQTQDNLLTELHDIFVEHKCNGEWGYHKNGKFWYAYMGHENSSMISFEDFLRITLPLREASHKYLKTLRRLEALPNEIQNADAECNQLNEAYEKAKEAEDNRDQYVATGLNIEELCRQIRDLLHPIMDWCKNNPRNASLCNNLQNIAAQCPHDTISWERYWQAFDNMIASKKQNEERFRENERRHRENVDNLENQINEARARQQAAKEEEDRRAREAEALERQRQQEEEQARLEREAKERERNRPKPEPYLDDPIHPSADQLKFQAARELRLLALYDARFSTSCDCKAKALIMSSMSNSAFSDLIGRIGVGVAFAPLEAIPGIGLAGKIGIGAVKAIASSVYGGANLSDELVGNLFNAIGGEIFSKLAGNEFVGNRLNELANGGLKEILEAEEIEAVTWEGTANSRRCGRITGKSTLLFNPKTGWVVIMIKIPNCPLIIVKYKVNESGVAQTDPIVRTIR